MDKVEMQSGQWMRQQGRLALMVLSWVSQSMEEVMADGMRLEKLTIKAPNSETGEVLVVLHGQTEDGRRHVAFSSGPDAMSAIANAKSKAEATGLRWREDTPWPGKAGGS